MEQFAEWLKDQLKVMDISQAELSRRSGLSVAQISRIVNKISPPGDKAIQLMADALGLPRDLLYRKSGKLPPEPARTDLIEQILHELGGVPITHLPDILEAVRTQKKISERHTKYNT